ncbi:hypothetical protein BN7_6183 [Wickerhamomyces ciferrii]|uniref:Enoyl reductase (ER) domain-containing protein n=1 Tax=Wickerhamomyces ciferrii (strain ATCC 14091 / BCRC 22168 / CBS 111 / JCM 3599 / NBRC 0793 / NRRL Y-1031 F-60-10) TaxID=1206466 RepID=K0KMT3_WICCF|nr:uncharacterized protein BN7_6183 [Wickerhamomyces ciferrii]CCH46590.1 hypothetical protein BN7_6183 [Wickerhamomyces ciferrii]
MPEKFNPDKVVLATYKSDKPPAPKPLSPPKLTTLERVGRPLRHVQYIPTKQLVFFSKFKDPTFTYDIKYKLPIKSNNVVIKIKAVGLNPVDLKIKNSYTSNFNYERGIGREYSGVVVEAGKKYKDQFKEGDEVCGIYFHPNSLGTISSDIQIDPSVDPIISKPKELSWEKSGSWLYTFGTAFQLLKNAEKQLSKDSVVLINGGSSSVGLMCIQILKHYYKVEDIAVICSGSAIKLVKETGAKLAINYKVNNNLPKVLQVLSTTGVYKDYDESGNIFESRAIPAKKFDLIVDTVGGYDILEKTSDYLAKGGYYITTVGDYKSDYTKDLYNAWNNPAMNARSLFGSVWSMTYVPFYFNPKPNDEWLQIGVDMLESGELDVKIDSIYDWQDYKKAENRLKLGHAHGKVILNNFNF